MEKVLKRDFCLLLILFFLLAIPSVPCFAGTEVSVEETYYDIYGTTEQDLRDQLDSQGPVLPSGRHDAATRWDISWNYAYSNREEDCRAASVDVKIKITHTFPRWDNPSRGSSSLQSRWVSYMKSLALHEEGHKQLAIKGGDAIFKALQSLRPASSCEQFGENANAKAHALLEKLNREQEAYDRSTRHGATQGARFSVSR